MIERHDKAAADGTSLSLVDSDHDSRAAANHRPVRSCEDPCLASRNEIAKQVLEICATIWIDSHFRDRSL